MPLRTLMQNKSTKTAVCRMITKLNFQIQANFKDPKNVGKINKGNKLGKLDFLTQNSIF